MTPAFWIAYAGIGFAWLMQIVVTQRWRRTAERLSEASDKQAAIYRATYRDLVTEYERLHTKYKELGGTDD